MSQNDALRVSSYLLSEGDCFYFIDHDVGFMIILLDSLLEDIWSTIVRANIIEFMFLRHWFGCCGSTKWYCLLALKVLRFIRGFMQSFYVEISMGWRHFFFGVHRNFWRRQLVLEIKSDFNPVKSFWSSRTRNSDTVLSLVLSLANKTLNRWIELEMQRCQ